MNSGDTAWVLVSTAFVLLMTMPGLAFFYGGLVRRKNVLSILMQCFIILCVISIQWVLFGYSLAFGPDFHGIIGNLSWAGLNHVGATPNPDYAATIPHSVFDYRRLRGKGEIFSFLDFHYSMGNICL
jgi:Amt family ammonium transporter